MLYRGKIKAHSGGCLVQLGSQEVIDPNSTERSGSLCVLSCSRYSRLSHKHNRHTIKLRFVNNLTSYISKLEDPVLATEKSGVYGHHHQDYSTVYVGQKRK